MKLIVASRFGMSIVDTETEEITDPINLPDGHAPYGISWNEENLFVAVRPAGGLSLERINVYDKDYNKVNELIYDQMTFSDLHQIFYYDSKLWVCSPGRNQITILYLPDMNYEIWKPNPDEETIKREGRSPLDYNHFNSIWIKGSRLYLVAHNFERPAEVWEFTYPNRELIKKWGVGGSAHNVYVKGGFRETLNSEDNVHYGRGLAFDGKNFYTGSSKYLKDRVERKKSLQGSVLVRDRSMKIGKEIPVNKGEVYEIRLLNEPDLAHNGLVWPPRY